MSSKLIFTFIFGTLVTIFGSLATDSLGQEDQTDSSVLNQACLAAANSAIRLGEASEARRWLDEIPSPDRGWEWKLLNMRADSSSNVVNMDKWSPVRLDTSNDGSQFATACSDGYVRLYDTKTLALISEWQVSDQTLYAARFRPDGHQLATCSRDGKLAVWDTKSLKLVWSSKSGGEGLADVAFNPSGTQVLFCSWYRGPNSVVGTVSLWDSSTGEQTWKTDFGVKPIVTARFSPDGKHFAVGTWDAEIGVWDTDSKGEPQVLGFKDRAQYSAIDDIAFSPDSKIIAAATKNGTPRIWEYEKSSKPIDLIGNSSSVFSVAFTNDGQSLLTGASDGVLTVWDIATRVPLYRFLGHSNRIGSICVLPMSNKLLTASADNSVRSWDLDVTRGFESTDAGKYVYGMVLAEQGNLLVTGGQSETTISVWDTTSKKAIRHFAGTNGTINYLDGDGKNWVAGGNWSGDVCIWDISTGEVLKQMGSKELGGLQQCALSDDRKWIAVATNKKQVVIWNVDTAQVEKTIPIPSGCWGVEFSADSKHLALGDANGNLNWVSANSWEIDWSCSVGSNQINTIRISPDGKWLATGSEAGQLCIVDLLTKSVRHQIQAHSQRIWSLDISPDGERIATGSADNRIRTWNPKTGTLQLTIADFSDSIYNVRFSVDGQSLFVNSLGARLVKLTAK